MVDRDSARAFRRALRGRRSYRAVVWSYRVLAVALGVGVPVLEHATGAAHTVAQAGVAVCFLAGWGGALMGMFVLLRAEKRLRGMSPWIGAFLVGLVVDLVWMGGGGRGQAKTR